MKKVVQSSDTRTVIRRLNKLEGENSKENYGIQSWISTCRNNLPKLIPALRQNKHPKTTNAIERFFKAFERFYKTRGGFHSVLSAKRQLILFLVVYLFTQQAESQKAPIEMILPSANQMPFYQLLNHPIQLGMVAVCKLKESNDEKMANEMVSLAA